MKIWGAELQKVNFKYEMIFKIAYNYTIYTGLKHIW